MITSKNKNLNLVKADPLLGLSILQKKNLCEQELTAIIDKLGDLTRIMHCPSIIVHFCNLVENLNKSQFTSNEKQQMVINQLIRLFPTLNNDTDINRLKLTINFMVLSGLVTKVSNLEITKSTAKSCIGFFVKK